MTFLSLYNINTSYSFREASTQAEQWLLRTGMIKKISAALYGFTSVGVKTIEKLLLLFSSACEKAGYNKIMLPSMSIKSFWHDKEITEAFVFDNLVISPTSEPIIYELFFKQKVYMNSWNFRNEKRGAFGLCRNMNFMMQDCYYSSTTAEQNDIFYQEALQIYSDMFSALGIKLVKHFYADERERSCEFLAESNMGSSIMDVCMVCRQTNCDCGEPKKVLNLLELGHVFFFFPKAWRTQQDFYAGSFGYGSGRLLQYLCELYSDDKGLRLPANLEPFPTVVLATSPAFETEAINIYQMMRNKSLSPSSIFFDDRKLSFGQKITDLEMLGCTKIIIIGQKYKTEGMIDVTDRWNSTTQKQTLLELQQNC